MDFKIVKIKITKTEGFTGAKKSVIIRDSKEIERIISTGILDYGYEHIGEDLPEWEIIFYGNLFRQKRVVTNVEVPVLSEYFCE